MKTRRLAHFTGHQLSKVFYSDGTTLAKRTSDFFHGGVPQSRSLFNCFFSCKKPNGTPDIKISASVTPVEIKPMDVKVDKILTTVDPVIIQATTSINPIDIKPITVNTETGSSTFLWDLVKYALLPAIGAAIAFFAEGRMKERQEKLASLSEIRKHIEKLRSKALETLSSLDGLEEIPRLGLYTHITKKERKKAVDIDKDLQMQLKEHDFFNERLIGIVNFIRDINYLHAVLSGIFSQSHDTWNAPVRLFTLEVANQAQHLSKEIDEQGVELKIACRINRANLYFKEKQFGIAAQEISKLETVNMKKIKMRPGFVIQALLHAFMIKAKSLYGKAIYLGDCDALEEVIQCCDHVITGYQSSILPDFKLDTNDLNVKAAKPIALCYKGHALNDQGKYKEAIDCFKGALGELPTSSSNLDGFGLCIHMLATEIYDELEKLKTLTEEQKSSGYEQILKNYKEILEILELIHINGSEGSKKITLKNGGILDLPNTLAQLSLDKFNNALQLDPGVPYLLGHRGWLLLSMAEWETDTTKKNLYYREAKKDFDKAIENDKNNRNYPVARAGRGIAALQIYKSSCYLSQLWTWSPPYDDIAYDLESANIFYKGKVSSSGKKIPKSVSFIQKKLNDALKDKGIEKRRKEKAFVLGKSDTDDIRYNFDKLSHKVKK